MHLLSSADGVHGAPRRAPRAGYARAMNAKARLLACPSCARHVRVSESACPFCATSLPASFGAGAAAKPPPARLSRGELYAFGTAAALAVAACGQMVGESDAGSDVGVIGRGANFIAPYGMPPVCGVNATCPG